MVRARLSHPPLRFRKRRSKQAAFWAQRREKRRERERIRNGIASLVMNDDREREREMDGQIREMEGTTRKSGSVVEGGKSPVTARLATDRY